MSDKPHDSLATDPRNPQVIYAGTYHLPWKTIDGGRHWLPIHDGMIDDSDVMSISVDRANPRRLYASACSGIYRSDNAGALSSASPPSNPNQQNVLPNQANFAPYNTESGFVNTNLTYPSGSGNSSRGGEVSACVIVFL